MLFTSGQRVALTLPLQSFTGMGSADVRPDVLLIPHGFQPSYERGFANGLARNGLNVELIASDRTPTDIDRTVRIVNLRGSQDPRRTKLQKTITLMRYLMRLAGKLVARRGSIIHLNGLLLGGTGRLAFIECHLYKLVAKKLFLTVHNILPHDSKEEVKKHAVRRLYAVPDKLVVHTEKMKCTLVEEYGVEPGKIVLMPHGVDDIPRFVGKPAPDIALRVLFFGSVLPYKGLDIFLAALQRCSRFPVVARIVGESRNVAYANEISEMIGRVGDAHQVTWARGFVPEEDVQQYFESADVVILPYRHIDQSGVLFTAFRFGVPVIAFDVGTFKDYVPAHAGEIVTEKSPEALADAIEKFYPRRAAYDRDAILDFARSFSWENTVRSLIPHYLRQDACPKTLPEAKPRNIGN